MNQGSTMYDRSNKIREKNNVLMKQYLERENEIQPLLCRPYNSEEELVFLKIKGMSKFWQDEEYINQEFSHIMIDLISGLYAYGRIFSYGIVGTNNQVNIYVGTSKGLVNSVKATLNASYPFIEIETVNEDVVVESFIYKTTEAGIVSGYPTKKSITGSNSFQIDRIIKGMTGSTWSYFVVAKAISPYQITWAHEKILQELGEVNKHIRVSTTQGELNNRNIEYIDYNAENYFKNLDVIKVKLECGMMQGMWDTSIYYCADNPVSLTKLSNLIKSVFSGDDSKPEKVRTLKLKGISIVDYLNRLLVIDNRIEQHYVQLHPAGKDENKNMDCFSKKYTTLLTSEDLAIFTQLPMKEVPGYYLNNYVSFETSDRGNRYDNFKIGNVQTGNKEVEIAYTMDVNDLNRHGLIVGVTGGGKTNTSKSLLKTLTIDHKKPFMVIESAKREYWDLKNITGFENLLVFTLGAEDENSVPYRINPFEVIGNQGVQTHIDYILSSFKASFDLFSPLPQVLEEAVYEVYKDYGWDILQNKNVYGRNEYPTLDDLYNKVDTVVDSLGYDRKLNSDIKAALRARINSLRIGGKGKMLNTSKSIPIEILLNRPVIMELEDVGDDDVKSFIIGILLIQIYEYRKSRVNLTKGLEHMLLIEEAHRLLKNTDGQSDSSRSQAVEFFCNMLAEIRSYGQGFLIADQVPTKLAIDTLKNTNLKIVHRIVMQDDRETIGRAMNMTQEQIDYISSLKRGIAAVYSEGDNRPKLVQMPLVKSDYSFNRTEILSNIKADINEELGNYDQEHEYGVACKYCREKCKHRNNAYKALDKIDIKELEDSNFSYDVLLKIFSSKKVKKDMNVVEGALNYSARRCLLQVIIKEKSKKEDTLINEIIEKYIMERSKN